MNVSEHVGQTDTKPTAEPDMLGEEQIPAEKNALALQTLGGGHLSCGLNIWDCGDGSREEESVATRHPQVAYRSMDGSRQP